MATAKISKKALTQDEFIEGVFDFGEWIEAHWRQVAIGIGAVVAIVLAIVFWRGAHDRATQDANRLLGQGLAAYAPTSGSDGAPASPRYAEALPLFEQAESRGSGRVAEIARMFKGRTLIAMGRPADAIPVLTELTGSPHTGLAAEAKMSLAEAAEATGDGERAATLLQEVASAGKDSIYPGEVALLALGDLRHRQGKQDEAKRIYDDLIAQYPQSPFAAEARQRTGTAAPIR